MWVNGLTYIYGDRQKPQGSWNGIGGIKTNPTNFTSNDFPVKLSNQVTFSLWFSNTLLPYSRLLASSSSLPPSSPDVDNRTNPNDQSIELNRTQANFSRSIVFRWVLQSNIIEQELFGEFGFWTYQFALPTDALADLGRFGRVPSELAFDLLFSF